MTGELGDERRGPDRPAHACGGRRARKPRKAASFAAFAMGVRGKCVPPPSQAEPGKGGNILGNRSRIGTVYAPVRP
nr:MAG TPA: hypothetical protein [Caudoviricetes sp.]